jgi:hypothetical protein
MAGPFDHIYTGSVYSLKYFLELVETSFTNFLNNLKVNNNNRIVSEYYPHTEFIHDKDLRKNPETVKKYQRRIQRFMEDYTTIKCLLLYCIHESSIQTEEQADEVIGYIETLLNTNYFKENEHILYIYLRYDENITEINNFFIYKLQKIQNKNLIFQKYQRNINKYGIWGDTTKYNEEFMPLTKYF